MYQTYSTINTFILATLPQASTLFSAAISESGGGRDVQLNNTAQNLGQAYAQYLNCAATDVSIPTY